MRVCFYIFLLSSRENADPPRKPLLILSSASVMSLAHEPRFAFVASPRKIPFHHQQLVQIHYLTHQALQRGHVGASQPVLRSGPWLMGAELFPLRRLCLSWMRSTRLFIPALLRAWLILARAISIGSGYIFSRNNNR